MKIHLFGRDAVIRTEALAVAVSVLALLGMLAGYVLLRNKGDIIIESASGTEQETVGSGILIQGGNNGAENGSTRKQVTDHGDLTDGMSVMVNPVQGGPETAKGRAAGMSVMDTADSAGDIDSSSVMSHGSSVDGDEDRIKVYVVGCVKNQGIVTIKEGQMICDAVAEAGGLTDDADADNINMVFSLNENVMLYIKSKEESKGVGNGAVVCNDIGAGAVLLGNDNGITGGRGVLVNINTAGIDELDTLPGVGEATARDIIGYRQKNGGFTTIEDIMKVPRIKENRFESIREFITVK